MKISNSDDTKITITNKKKLIEGTEGTTYTATFEGKPVLLKKLKNFTYEKLKMELALLNTVGSCSNPSLGIACFRGVIIPKNKVAVYRLAFPENIRIIYTPEDEKEKDDIYFIYDLLEGQDLLEYINKNKLSKEQKVSIIKQLLTTLSTLHDKGIVHGDIKPENLMYDGKKLVVIDFGLSCFIEDCKSSIAKKGTHIYMAPELFTEVFGDSNVKSVDIFAAGMTIYTLLVGALYIIFAHTGKLPIVSIETVGPIVTNPLFYTSASAKSAFLSSHTEELYALFSSMISQDPSKRPTAAEALRAFETLEREGKLFSGAGVGGAGSKVGGRRTRKRKTRKFKEFKKFRSKQ